MVKIIINHSDKVLNNCLYAEKIHRDVKFAISFKPDTSRTRKFPRIKICSVETWKNLLDDFEEPPVPSYFFSFVDEKSSI